MIRTATIGLFAFIVACEPRAPEPVPHKPSDSPLAPPAATSAAPSVAVSEEPPPACVEPWTSTATREVTGDVPDPQCPDDPGPVPSLRLGTVRFPEVGSLEVAVEIAEKDEHRMRGLMYRKDMSDGAGMLFIFERQKKLQFWMKNTCIPLDMIFIDKGGTIVAIEENTPTLSMNTFGPKRCDAKFVLEVNAGWARKNGVKPGQKLDLPHGT
ncbi:MAG: DUF192 domain-containing protein [Polyangiaceae bacterium]|nr:DUF192 domain-containing protein [Polyangiaceae bacterium]